MNNYRRDNGKGRVIRCRVLVLLLTVGCLAATGTAHAEFEDKMVSARALGMGGAFVAVADDASAVYWNPGALPQVKNMKITTMRTELFGMDALKHDYLAGAIPVPYMKATVGGSWSHFGGRNYQEDEYTFAIAREMGTGHMMGVALRQLSSRITSTPTMEGFALDVGLLVNVNRHLKFGLMARNINKPVVNEELPQLSRAGIALQAFPRLTLAVDAVQETGREIEIHIGEEYLVSKHFAVRAGYSTNPKRFTAGFGFNLLSWQVDYAYMTHDVLPPTHRVSLTFDFWKSREKTKPDEVVEKEETEEIPVIDQEEKVPKPYVPQASRGSGGELRDPKKKLIDINTCYAEDLVTVPGIGPSIANNIILYRELNGLYEKLEDLINVPKIGEKLFDKIKKFLTVEEGR